MLERIKDDERFRGPKGPTGDRGKDGLNGKDAEITNMQLAAITNAAIVNIKQDPSMKVDLDQLTDRILGRLPNITVLSDGDPQVVSLREAAKANRNAVMRLQIKQNPQKRDGQPGE